MKTNDTNENKWTLTGLFDNKDGAECAYEAFDQLGYDRHNLDVLMSDETLRRNYGHDGRSGTKALEGAGAGSAIGGAAGAVIGAIAAIGTVIALPGFGIVVAGPIASALVGGGAGVFAGGLTGALIGAGMPEEESKAYESGIKQGGILLRARLRNTEDGAHLANQWRSCGGKSVYCNAWPQRTPDYSRHNPELAEHSRRRSSAAP